MRCSNIIVPGLSESDEFIKGHQDIGMKIQRELDNNASGPTFKILPNYKPVNTVKAYKLFRVKNNKLYPLFVDANRALPVGKWLEAEAGALTDKGKVKSSIGALAFRPGWHSGDLPLATHIGGKVDPDTGNRVKGSMKPNVRENNQVWAEIEVPADFDWQSIAVSRASLVKSGPNKGKPNAREAHITDQLPSKGYYKYKTNANMTGSWLISGELKINRILSDVEVRDINGEAGAADLVRDYELPYSKRVESQETASKKLKRNLLKAKAGKFAPGVWQEQDAKAVEGLYKPYKHLEQEIVRKEELRGDAAVQGWFRSLREKVAIGEMTDAQRRGVLQDRIDRLVK